MISYEESKQEIYLDYDEDYDLMSNECSQQELDTAVILFDKTSD